MAELGEDDAAAAVRAKVHTRSVDRAAEGTGHRRRVDQSPRHAIDGDLDSGETGHLVRCRSRAVDGHIGFEAPAALRGHATHPYALTNHAGHPLAGEHACAPAHGVGEQPADERHDVHVPLAGREDHLVHVRGDLEIGLELARVVGRDDLDGIAPASETLHGLLELRAPGGLLLPSEGAVLLVPVATSELHHERQVLGHAGRVELVVVTRRLVEGIRPREARAGRPAAWRSCLEHGDLGATLREPVGDIRAYAARADHDNVGPAHVSAPVTVTATRFMSTRSAVWRGREWAPASRAAGCSAA